MLVVYVVIWSSAVILALSAVWALVWAIRTGQFQGLRQGAESIFDAAEPVGLGTDRFPSGKGKTARRVLGAKHEEDKWPR